MALDDKDLEKIGEVVDEKLDLSLSPIEDRLGSMQSDILTIKNDVNDVKKKVDDVWRAENEDILALADDIKIIKKKIGLRTAS